MKKKIVLTILLDTNEDEFGINMESEGFNLNTPQQNSLLIASILKVAQDQELSQFHKHREEG